MIELEDKTEKGAEIMLNYTGPSMNPTLKTGDGMRVLPYGDREIQVGDVVVFQSPDKDYYIVHRVISINSHGVRTIGDNNNNIDPWVLSPDAIIGRVVSVRRESRDITIHGGARGKLLFPVLQSRKRAKAKIFRALHPIYDWLSRFSIFRRILSPFVRTHFLYFSRPNGVEIQLVMGQRVIARRPPGEKRWYIRRPFRLLVDEASLPGEPE